MQSTTSVEDKIQLSEYALVWVRQTPTSLESGELCRLQKLVWQSKIALLLEPDVRLYVSNENIGISVCQLHCVHLIVLASSLFIAFK